MRVIVASLLLATWLMGCRTNTPYSYSALPDPVATGKILFASFRISTDSVGKNNIILLTTSSVEGTLKAQPEPESIPDRIIVYITDKTGSILQTTTIAHPLVREAEYTKEDGSFERKVILLKEVEFFIRVYAPSTAARLQVDEIREGQKVNSTSFLIP